MDGVVTILDPQNFDQLLALWHKLTAHCNVPEVNNHFLPHFSWHVAETYDCEALKILLDDTSVHSQPFSAHTAGLGIFPGEKPVVYISLVKDRQLMDFHEMLWVKLKPLSVNSSPYYAPQNWVPHITVFFDELYKPLPPGWQSTVYMNCVLDFLIEQNLYWAITVNNIAYGCMGADQMTFQHYRFGL